MYSTPVSVEALVCRKAEGMFQCINHTVTCNSRSCKPASIEKEASLLAQICHAQIQLVT